MSWKYNNENIKQKHTIESRSYKLIAFLYQADRALLSLMNDQMIQVENIENY